jgi:hypothetical protein
MENINKEIIRGVLTQQKEKTFLLGLDGEHHLKTDYIWPGYVPHWLGKPVCARYLTQRDYERGEPIVLIWPDVQTGDTDYVDLYYNERLTHYPVSIFGHNAINVNGEVFNFSHLLIENEATNLEDYLYRPPLGEFAPHPKQGIRNVEDMERPYYDMFGRLFMRTIHVLRIQGLNTEQVSSIYHKELNKILNTPRNPKCPEKYRDFNIFTRSCTTIIRDGLRECGFRKISGIMPRDFFVNAAYHFLNAEKEGALRLKRFTMKQLKVAEAPHSRTTPLFNPTNRIRRLVTRSYFDRG